MVDIIVGRIMLATGCLIFLALFSVQAFGRTVSVFDVKHSVPLRPGEPILRDYYLNGGYDMGLRKGMTIEAERRVTLSDSFQSQNPETLVVKVGTFKVIHVQDSIAVARLLSHESEKDQPILENYKPMIGDVVNIAKARTPQSSKTAPRRVMMLPPPGQKTKAKKKKMAQVPMQKKPLPKPKPKAKVLPESKEVSVQEMPPVLIR